MFNKHSFDAFGISATKPECPAQLRISEDMARLFEQAVEKLQRRVLGRSRQLPNVKGQLKFIPRGVCCEQVNDKPAECSVRYRLLIF